MVLFRFMLMARSIFFLAGAGKKKKKESNFFYLFILFFHKGIHSLTQSKMKERILPILFLILILSFRRSSAGAESIRMNRSMEEISSSGKSNGEIKEWEPGGTACVVGTGGLNLRGCACIDCAVLARLDRNQKVTVLANQTLGRIRTNHRRERFRLDFFFFFFFLICFDSPARAANK